MGRKSVAKGVTVEAVAHSIWSIWCTSFASKNLTYSSGPYGVNHDAAAGLVRSGNSTKGIGTLSAKRQPRDRQK
jgi:hypothetical protein